MAYYNVTIYSDFDWMLWYKDEDNKVFRKIHNPYREGLLIASTLQEAEDQIKNVIEKDQAFLKANKPVKSSRTRRYRVVV